MMRDERRDGSSTRVLFVDCNANDRGFIRDAPFRALADELSAAGDRALLVDLIRDDPPPGKSTIEVLTAVEAAAPAVVVVARAWSADLVAELRAAASEAEIVRYSHGAPSPIDTSFDAVLDGEGIRRHLAGADDVAAPSWRRTRREMAIKRPPPAPSSDRRPTISGPARGCPFLVDVRTSVAYRDSGIDFDSVQSKGCSFCLDNVGAFATFPEQEVVESWLAQLRALRSERPDVREVLLTDERPHPYLPALFREILADPALHGIEILIKSRVDWLAEFADNHLRAACDLAERSSSLLHVYLIGFESFHQADLDLFNKAVSVADNIRAIDILRELEKRHPRSFEFRRHRAHGVVLFHPWTTPESLLDNARVMREVRFHELRSQALRTRLRLYASVPLHALAAEHDLLVDRFDEGRSDRAIEQGYDASIPWKFADPRIEAIFQACYRIGDDLPQWSDADILELVTRFVMRWPGFADAPQLTALPIEQALFSWGSSPADVLAVAGAEIAGFDREVEAVAAGDKSACLKEGVAADDAEGLTQAYQAMGLAAAIVSAHRRGGDDGVHQPGASHAIVAVARDADTLADVLRHQHAVERGEASSIPAMGQLMGYPRCCVATFSNRPTHGDNQDLERAPFRAHPDRPLAPLINRFGAVSLNPHFLCAPDCRPSIELARHRLAAIERLDSAAAERIAAHLSSTVLRLDYRRAALLEGAWDGDRYLVHAMHAMRIPEIAPASVQALRLFADRVVFEARDGSESTIYGSPILIEPGAALAPPVRRVLAAAPRSRAPGGEGRPAQHGESRSASSAAAAGDGPASSDDAAGLDVIVAALAPSTRVADYTVERTEAATASELRVTLGGAGASLGVRISRWDPSRPTLSRRGAWALDLDEDREPADTDRKVIGALARLLPAGSHARGNSHGNSQENSRGDSEGDSDTPGRPDRGGTAARPIAVKQTSQQGVVCTAPWTTLEVVDPDGLVRQCCADWTAGDRGSLRERSLAAVWNGPGYRQARKVMSGADLSSLCHEICPRLYDAKFGESELAMIDGADRFVDNQRMLFDDIAARREVVRASPLYIAVCPSTYCNYDCIMCLHGRTPRRDLPESIWEELVAMLPTLRVLTLLGGEPLANPAAMQFLRGWDRAQYPDAAVSIVTNGSLLGTNVLHQLERCNFANVTISLNAGDAETHARVQRGSDLADVLANLDALIELRRAQRADFPIVLSFVVQSANHHNLIEFGEIARSRGLPIRLMPLSPEGVEELDFYGDADQVARILESLDAMRRWADAAAPQFAGEIHGTRSAVANKASAARLVPG